MVFVRTPSFSLRYQGNGRIEDVHLFMRCLYAFWYFKGLWNTCVASFVDFLNSLVVFAAVLFLTMIFDWSVAMTCDEVSCVNATLVRGMHTPTVFGMGHMMLGLVLLISSFAALCYELVKFVETCRLQSELETMLRTVVDTGYVTPVHRLVHVWRSMRARAEGHEEVCLTGELTFVGNMSWGGFLDTVCEHIQQDRSFGIVEHHAFDSLRAVQALMVYDNHIITLYQHGILERGTLKYSDERLLKILICGMFDEFNTLRVGRNQVQLVRLQVVKYFCVYALLYPFVVTLSVMRVLVKNAAMMRSDWGNYMSRDWNSRALWTFRLYNEVPHILSARMLLGRQTAVEMVRRLQPYSSGGRFVRRTASAIVLIVVSLAFLNSALLVAGSIGGISLLWWLSAALVAFSVFSEKESFQREYNHLADLEKLVKLVHYSQKEWFHSGDTFYNTLTWDFLKSRFFLIVSDLARTLFMPLILLGILCDGSIPELVECVYNESVRVDGLGSVARGSAFGVQVGDGGGDGGSDSVSPLSYFSQKDANSIASFCSIYSGWLLRRLLAVDEVVKATGETATAPTVLDRFVANLHKKVDVHSRERQGEPLQVTSGTLNAGWCQSESWEQSTAHEREQLFVSQVMTASPTEFARVTRAWDTASSSRFSRECALR
ncbi:putative proteasome regulatory non-ATPase subunit [Trypanosoma grayi]|uniref:putative proteasome regulatory non-ATPase subunit n=1 Tax=Trypanosoma grayi TaxID=71804 RepID=UPI0004F404DB|nr:putative proteasome regulatory non-ATPase subunit [Trypanosoma grayi]KEG15118.1 putative proteasome regulatory non-ATPase subunit [Trypanosoma grayi]